MERLERLTTATQIVFDEGVVSVIGVGVDHSAETVDESFDAIKEMTEGERQPILFDVRNWGAADITSWMQFIKRIEEAALAAAVVSSPDQHIEYGSTFADMLDRLVVPFRVHADEAEARQFLDGFVDD